VADKDKPKPATADKAGNSAAASARGRKRGRGRGAAAAGGRAKPKTAEELDAEMADYWGVETGTSTADAPMSNGGAVQPAATNGGEAIMEDDGKYFHMGQQGPKQSSGKNFDRSHISLLKHLDCPDGLRYDHDDDYDSSLDMMIIIETSHDDCLRLLS
jgi:hypothetical protein